MIGEMKKMKRLYKPLASLGVGILAMAIASFASNAKPAFTITISAPASVKLGSAIEMSIIVKNVADHPIVLGSDGLTHNETNFTYDVRDAAGTIPSATPYMKGPGPSFFKMTYSKLAPGEMLKLSIDLCKMFEFTPGKYTVQLSRFENDFALGGKPKGADAGVGPPHNFVQKPPVLFEPSPHSNLKVTSNKITVTVVP
jgi:hypothetical protein